MKNLKRRIARNAAPPVRIDLDGPDPLDVMLEVAAHVDRMETEEERELVWQDFYFLAVGFGIPVKEYLETIRPMVDHRLSDGEWDRRTEYLQMCFHGKYKFDAERFKRRNMIDIISSGEYRHHSDYKPNSRRVELELARNYDSDADPFADE